MATRVQRHANVSEQATLLDGLDVSPLKWRVCGCGLNRFVHEDMNHISNVKVHLKTRSGNVNISLLKQLFYAVESAYINHEFFFYFIGHQVNKKVKTSVFFFCFFREII